MQINNALSLLTTTEFVFFIISAVTILAAITALESKEVIYGAFSLGVMFLGIAGLFILLDATYLAMFQVSVYIGAVVVLILFTIMVVPRERWLRRARTFKITPEVIAGVIASLMLILSIVVLYLSTPAWSVIPSEAPFDWSVSRVAQSIVIEYGIALQILALVLFAGLLGALTLAKVEVDAEAKEEDTK